MKTNLLLLALVAAMMAGCPGKETTKTEYVPVDRNVTINNPPPAAPPTNTVIHEETIVHDVAPAPARPANVTIENKIITPTAAPAKPTNITIQNQITTPTATP